MIQETTISEVEGEEGNFLAGPEWKVGWSHPAIIFVISPYQHHPILDLMTFTFRFDDCLMTQVRITTKAGQGLDVKQVEEGEVTRKHRQECAAPAKLLGHYNIVGFGLFVKSQKSLFVPKF